MSRDKRVSKTDAIKIGAVYGLFVAAVGSMCLTAAFELIENEEEKRHAVREAIEKTSKKANAKVLKRGTLWD